MTQVASTRIVDGVELPPVGRWKIDPTHSTVEFIGRHLMVSKVRGRFTDVDGAIHITDDPRESSVEVVIATDSLDSRDPQRDAHLRSDELFAVDQFPTITFRSTSVRHDDRGWTVTGDLTIRDVTRPVVLDVDYAGAVTDPWGGQRAGFSATTEVDREDWGLTWNMALEAGGLLVSKRIRIEIEIEAVLEG